MKKELSIVLGFTFMMLLLSPSNVGWKTPTFPPYVWGEMVESPAYVEFWNKQRRHGWYTISYKKEDGKTYFMRNGIECKFW